MSLARGANDAEGHEVGDGVPLQVADLLRLCNPEQDFLALLGGEELAKILPKTTLETAAKVARRLTWAVRGTEFETTAGPVKVTASASAAARDSVCDDVNRLFALADARVLRAKSAGRDQLIR